MPALCVKLGDYGNAIVGGHSATLAQGSGLPLSASAFASAEFAHDQEREAEPDEVEADLPLGEQNGDTANDQQKTCTEHDLGRNVHRPRA
jgi:hypothetical protein